jgi:hypothetical protein
MIVDRLMRAPIVVGMEVVLQGLEQLGAADEVAGDR